MKPLSTIPKVVISTSNTPVYIEESFRVGATAYLIKPANLSGLQQMAKKLLDFAGLRLD